MRETLTRHHDAQTAIREVRVTAHPAAHGRIASALALSDAVRLLSGGRVTG